MSERETALKALTEYVMHHGAIHAEDCPQDDTCACLYEPLNAGVNLAVRLLAAGADPVPVCQWREIATAPKDGTRVLVMWEYWSADPFVAYFKHGRWNGEVALSECSDDGPTHWMPLPAPPVALVPAEQTNKE